MTAKLSFAIGSCEGRVVAVGGPASGTTTTHVLRALRIDAVVVVTLDPSLLQVCVDVPSPTGDSEWDDVPPIVKGLTLPFRELMPGLTSEADELAEARSRLLPGEALDAEAFARLAAVVRPVLRARRSAAALGARAAAARGARREADEVAGPRPDPGAARPPDVAAGAGVRAVRRRPGAWCRARPTSTASAPTYPPRTSSTPNHGFATVPSGHAAPRPTSRSAGVRLRLPQPVAVALTPGTPAAGAWSASRDAASRSTRRREPFWLTPSLDDWSLVVDFPAPVDAVVLELAEGHDLVFAAGAANGPFAVTAPGAGRPACPGS